MGLLDLDTTSDDDVWVVLRRVHFYASDLILNETEAFGVGPGERRLLDALDYAVAVGRPSVSTSTLCNVIPAPMKYSTALSTLQRMEEREWVTSRTENASKRQRWEITDKGDQIRELYGQISEQPLQQLYAAASQNLREHLFEFGRRALDFMNDRLVPVLDAVEESEAQPLRIDHWRALRRVHFYLSDLIVRETEPMGVGMNERRVLDTFGFAHKHGVDGLSVTSIGRLNLVLTRQNILSVLERAQARGWVTQTSPARTRNALWDLTDKGRRVREIYKAYAQLKLCEVYGMTYGVSQNEEDGYRFLELTKAAQRYRDVRFIPVIDELRHTRVG
jgi:DNA-binding MarR family transcriptional regulator